jgi:hypothetical protein
MRLKCAANLGMPEMGKKSTLRLSIQEFLAFDFVHPARELLNLTPPAYCLRSPRRLNGPLGPFKGQRSKFKVGNGVRCTARGFAQAICGWTRPAQAAVGAGDNVFVCDDFSYRSTLISSPKIRPFGLGVYPIFFEMPCRI